MTYQTPENFAQQRSIKVQCKCGWTGMAPGQLAENIVTRELICPQCCAEFKRFPFPYPKS